MVTDISPATEDYALTARFPNGVPAVSDESMSQWMLHLYKQFPDAGDIKGVEVLIDAIDPNNNFINIGTATTDESGAYSYMWETPNVPGKYTIIATFKGSNSYWSSSSQTGMGVVESPITPQPLPQQQTATDQSLMYGLGEIFSEELIGFCYGRFLIINSVAIAIAMMMATPMPRTYISVGGKASEGCAVGVGAASFTTKAVSACDGQ
jgi:hypothetical protein